MKVHKILDNYCRLYGVSVPIIDATQTHYFVAISPEGASVWYMRKASKILGRIVGEAMKRGTVLYVHYGSIRPLTWETWKQTWTQLFAPKERKTKAPEPNRIRPYHSEIFAEMQQERPRKKPRKQGFIRTFSANQSMNLLSPTCPIRAEYI